MKAYLHSFGKRHLSAKQVMPLYCEDSQILVLVLNSIDVSVKEHTHQVGICVLDIR